MKLLNEGVEGCADGNNIDLCVFDTIIEMDQ